MLPGMKTEKTTVYTLFSIQMYYQQRKSIITMPNIVFVPSRYFPPTQSVFLPTTTATYYCICITRSLQNSYYICHHCTRMDSAAYQHLQYRPIIISLQTRMHNTAKFHIVLTLLGSNIFLLSCTNGLLAMLLCTFKQSSFSSYTLNYKSIIIKPRCKFNLYLLKFSL